MVRVENFEISTSRSQSERSASELHSDYIVYSLTISQSSINISLWEASHPVRMALRPVLSCVYMQIVGRPSIVPPLSITCCFSTGSEHISGVILVDGFNQRYIPWPFQPLRVTFLPDFKASIALPKSIIQTFLSFKFIPHLKERDFFEQMLK